MATTNIGKTKRSTDEMINDAVDRQQSWLENRRTFTRNFLSRFHIFNKTDNANNQPTSVGTENTIDTRNKRILHAYWLPIVCALLVILIAITVMLFKINTPVKVVVPAVPEPVVKTIDRKSISRPMFDLVRIEQSGNMVLVHLVWNVCRDMIMSK